MEFDYSQQPGLKRRNLESASIQQPLVSIITPYYNGGKYILQTSNCVLNQTFPWFEWIIVDDGSTNQEDVELLKKLKEQDSRIYVLYKENGGIASARNYGIRHSRSNYVLPLDSDDLIEPVYIEYCWWMLQKNPKAAWAYTDSVGFQGQEYLWHKPFDPLQMKRENLLTATALIRKEVLVSVGGYSEAYKHYNEDWYAWLKIISRGGFPVQSCGEYLFWYRRNDTGVLSKVKTDREISERNRKLIASAASGIQDPMPGIVYPRLYPGELCFPKRSSWENSVYEEKIRSHILFLLTGTESENNSQRCYDLISGLNEGCFDISIITTNSSTIQSLQKFRKLTPNVFHMANFVELNDYAEFVSYYLISRQVDCIVVSGSRLGYMFLPWIREKFSDIVIADIVDGQGKDCVPTVIERTFHLDDLDKSHFSAEIQRMIKDENLISQRRRQSEDLRSRSPVSSVQYLQEIQKNTMIAVSVPSGATLCTRAIHLLKEKGIREFMSRLWRWIKRKIN